MKRTTTVLTLASLAALLVGRPALAQSVSAPSSVDAKGYDPLLVSSALANQSLLNAVNAQRAAQGLPALSLDPALSAAAQYEMADQVKQHFGAFYALLGDAHRTNGQLIGTQVAAPQMAADFGSAAAGVTQDQFTTSFSPTDDDNWPALVNDWIQTDQSYTGLVDDPSANTCGVAVVDTGSVNGTNHVYRWALFLGHTAAPGASSVSTPAALDAKGYDPLLVSSALANQSLLNAVNAQRAAQGLPALSLDPALSAAAQYEMADQVKQHFGAFYALLGDAHRTNGQLIGTQVAAPQMAADFGSAAAGVTQDQFTTSFSPTDDDNWPVLAADWQQQDQSYAGLVDDPSANTCGVAVVDTGSVNGTNHVYRWALFLGHSNKVAAVPTPAPTGPTVSTGLLDPTVAANALAAQPTATETALLQTINDYRATLGSPPLKMDPALYAAAYYQEYDQLKLTPRPFTVFSPFSPSAFQADGVTGVSPATLAADFGSKRATFLDSTFTNAYGNGMYLRFTGNWTVERNIWRVKDSTFQQLIIDNSYTNCGLCIADTGATLNGSELYQWAILVGK